MDDCHDNWSNNSPILFDPVGGLSAKTLVMICSAYLDFIPSAWVFQANNPFFCGNIARYKLSMEAFNPRVVKVTASQSVQRDQ